MRIGLAVYGTVFSMGLHPASRCPVIRPRHLMDQALAAGLQGVELPVALLEGEGSAALARYAREHGLFITLATGGYHPEKLAADIALAARLGAATVRTVVGGAKIGGDPRPLTGLPQSFLLGLPAAPPETTTVTEPFCINPAP